MKIVGNERRVALTRTRYTDKRCEDLVVVGLEMSTGTKRTWWELPSAVWWQRLLGIWPAPRRHERVEWAEDWTMLDSQSVTVL